MALLNAGNLAWEITLQTVSITQSESGMQIKDWERAASTVIWADRLNTGTSEVWKARQRFGSYIDAVFVTYDMDPRPSPESSRIVFDGRVWDIKGVEPVEELGRLVHLEIAVVAAGETGATA